MEQATKATPGERPSDTFRRGPRTRLPAGARPSRALARYPDAKHDLRSAQVLDRKLFATDSRVLVRVELAGEAVDGPVSRHTLEAAERGQSLELREDVAIVETGLGPEVHRREDNGRFPDGIPQLFDSVPRADGSVEVTLDPRALVRLAEAIGSEESVTLHVPAGPRPDGGTLYVTGRHSGADALLALPRRTR